MTYSERKHTETSLKRRARSAAQMTAEQQAQRNASSRSKKTRAKRESQTPTTRSASRPGKQNAAAAATGGAQKKTSRFSKKARVALVAVVSCVVMIALLYPVGKDYYQALRSQQRLEAQLEAVNERNAAIQEENDALETEEGVENEARQDLGWVMPGEESVVVTNTEGAGDTSSKLPDQIDVDDIHAPQTWYYAIFDAIFSVQE